MRKFVANAQNRRINKVINNFLQDYDSSKETIIFMQDMETNDKVPTKNHKNDLLREECLKEKFNIFKFSPYSMGVKLVNKLINKISGPINFLVDFHGNIKDGSYYVYCLDLQKPSETTGIKIENFIKDQLLEYTKGKAFKLFLTACYGNKLTDFVGSLPDGTMIITLSDKDKCTSATDFCNINMENILDSIKENKESFHLEDLLIAYTASQNFISNTPNVRIYKKGQSKDFKLDEYLQNKIINDKISFNKDLLSKLFEKAPEGYFDNLENEVSNSNKALSEFRAPNYLTKLEYVIEYLEEHSSEELINLFSSYYINKLEGCSIDQQKIIDLYKNYKDNIGHNPNHNSIDEYTNLLEHSPVVFLQNFDSNRDSDVIFEDEGKYVYEASNYSVLLTLSAINLIGEISIEEAFDTE